MKLGYLAMNQYGHCLNLTGKDHPRKQLLEKTGATHADKMYVDGLDGKPRHKGYVIKGVWWNVFEVHSWNGEKS